MSNFHYIHKLVNLQDFIITDLQFSDDSTNVFVELPTKPHLCPRCNNSTSYIHDYRIQKIKDIPIYKAPCFIFYRKRRYFCPHCLKKFYEDNHFVERYLHMSNRLNMWVVNSLIPTHSMASIASDLHVSAGTIARILSKLNFSHISSLPNVLSIDEFKGDTTYVSTNVLLLTPVKERPWISFLLAMN